VRALAAGEASDGLLAVPLGEGGDRLMLPV
jgi:hypothetical protein